MHLSDLNIAAVALAALSNFFIGGIWYSPLLFGKPWMTENGFTPEGMKNRNMGRIFGLTLVYSLVMAANTAMFLHAFRADLGKALAIAFHGAAGWIIMALFIIGLFEGRRARYLLIHAGYILVSLTAMTIIIAWWG